VSQTLPGLFRERVARTPDGIAYRYFDAAYGAWRELRWAEAAREVAALRAALAQERLQAGDRVAIMLRNCPAWVCFEQAALSLGLVVVPLYTNDRADNVSYILQDAQVRVLLVENDKMLSQLSAITPQLQGLERLLTLEPSRQGETFPRLAPLSQWARWEAPDAAPPAALAPDALATIVYTSGTTGRPKGVMLSHRNILFNVDAALQLFDVYREDLLLSFLPLSHTLERTVGYYLPMATGSTVAYARSVQELAEDLLSQRPTVLISVPRIYERVYNKIQLQLGAKSPLARRLFHAAVATGWRRFQHKGGGGLRWLLLDRLVAAKIRAKLGGRLRLAITGGAAMPPEVAKTFIGLGLSIIQGYGLTEASPIVSGNPVDDNEPASVGIPLPGVEVRIGAQDELLTRSPSVMLGYWQHEQATRAMIDADGWLHTGDQARIEGGHIYITGRIKDIIVLSNGEKVPPSDLEMAITLDPLFEQALIIGEGRPFLSAMVVLSAEAWQREAAALGIDPQARDVLQSRPVQRFVLDRIARALREFPGQAKVRAVIVHDKPWSIEDDTLTPTMKLRRAEITRQSRAEIDALYQGVR
jgi:long-chain acyl-CoA synthetase